MINVIGAPDGQEAPPEPPAELPRMLPVLPLRETVPFPDTVLPLAVGQPRSVALVNDALGSNRLIVMVASRDRDKEEPAPNDLYRVGVVGTIARMMRAPDETLRILVQGGTRVRLDDFLQTEPYLTAQISELPDIVDPDRVVASHNYLDAELPEVLDEVVRERVVIVDDQ